MAFTLPNLPYPTDALAPHLSKETLEFHHGKHHGTYVTTLNRLVKENSKLKDSSLEEILKKAEPGPLFNNAAQHWNHSFYWTSMKPKGGGHPTGKLADGIKKAFGEFEAFKKKFIAAADCGFSSQALYRTEVHPTVVWEKFKALRQGADLATKRLWR